MTSFFPFHRRRHPGGAGRRGRFGAAGTCALAASLLALGGCATVPAVSGPTLSVAEARAAGDDAGAVPVRWGGTIAEVRNTADGTTVLEVVSRPLRVGGRPRGGDTTDGRFLAEIDAFLDPAIVRAGRDVTVTGRVAGQRDGAIGETAYRFPVVAVDDYRYWRPEPPPAHFPHPVPLGHGYGHRHGIFHDWPHSPHRHRRGRGAMVSGTVSF